METQRWYPAPAPLPYQEAPPPYACNEYGHSQKLPRRWADRNNPNPAQVGNYITHGGPLTFQCVSSPSWANNQSSPLCLHPRQPATEPPTTAVPLYRL
jgi:hypothetical protein